VGNAGCPPHPQPRVHSAESTRVSHHRFTGTPGIPARNGFNGLLRALPGDRACLSPSPAKCISQSLTPASRRQDHTTSPSASKRSRLWRRRVHRIPFPTSVTIAKRPSFGNGTAVSNEVIWVARERIYFCKRGWTEKPLICPSGKSDRKSD
jgi:hypothetical protein